MQALIELQAIFLAGVLDGETSAAASLFRNLRSDGAARFVVYVNNVHENMEASLRISFPAVLQLVGKDYFSQCVRGYRLKYPSSSGDLQHSGSAFASYLDKLHAQSEYHYLADVARLEWAVQESLVAADHGPLDLTRLTTVSPSDYDRLSFCLHPAVRLIASRFPIHAIWWSNTQDSLNESSIDLRDGPDHVLITRMDGSLECSSISAIEYGFLEALQTRQPFSLALENVLRENPTFDVGDALRRFVLRSVIVDFEVTELSTEADT